MKKNIILSVLLLLTILPTGWSQIGLRIPDTTAVQGSTIDVPIYADSALTGENILSYFIQVSFNEYYFKPVSVISTGTISQQMGNIAVNISAPGLVTIAGAGTTPFTGEGIFIYIRFQVLQVYGDWINFTNKTSFNEGVPAINYTSGYINIVSPPSITIYPDNGSLTVGEQLQFNVGGGTSPYTWFVTNPTVASIDNTGLLSALHPGFTKVVVQDSTGIKDTTSAYTEIRALRLTIPNDLSQWPGNTIDIPVFVSSLAGLNVVSGNLKLNFDPNILTPVGIDQDTTILASYSMVMDTSSKGNISLAFAGSSPISGSGVLLYIRFKVSTINTWSTNINITDALFNEDILANYTNGYFTTKSFPSLSIYPNNGSLVAGDTLQLAVYGEAISPLTWSVNDTSIASISQSGLLVAKKGGSVIVSVRDSVGASATSDNFLVYDTRIVMPDTSICFSTQALEYPLLITSLPKGDSIFSIQAAINYDTTYLEFLDIETAGSITDGWTYAINTTIAGQVNFACSNISSLKSTGVILNLKFSLKPSIVGELSTNINLNNVMLNEGKPNPLVVPTVLTVNSVKANFNFTIDSATMIVTFNNTSSGSISLYSWDFGDGNASSDYYTSHQYNKAGLYSVSLAIKDNTLGCIDSYAELLKIGQVNCKADFDYVVSDDTVTFTNTSTGNLTNYYWSFDDGGFTTDQNPVHTFSSEGIHSVSLTVSDSGAMCMNSINKKIQVGNVNCSAKFSYFVDIPTLTVSCKNEAIGAATEYYWYFGDGTLSSDVNPVHTFLYPGFYTIGLNTFNSQNWCMDYYQANVLIGSEGIDCQADFIYQIDTSSDNTVKFFDNSIGNITKYLWDFDDCDNLNNCAFSSDTNPSYAYKHVGYYDVCLSVTNNLGVSNINCKWIDVNADAKTNCLAKFSYTVDTLNNNTVSFVSQSLGKPNKFKWNFGDSAISYANDSAAHHYKEGGFYLVSMDISTPEGCTSNSYQVVNIKQPFGLYAMFGYNSKDYSQKAGGYPVDFVGAGLGDQGKLRWSYGDGGTDSTSNTPTHYYDTAGFYYVCLTYSDTVTKQKSTACDTISTCQNDSIPPVAVCKDIIVTLNGGTAIIKPQDINNGSYDNCAIYDYYIDNSVFNSTGFKLVHLIVTDYSNHKDTCSSIVTVQTDIKEKDYYSSSLMKIFPNPFGDRLSILYQLPVTCNVEMTIFNLVGEPVFIVNKNNQLAGYYTQTYDASMLESGSYIIQLKTSAGSLDRKIIIKR